MAQPIFVKNSVAVAVLTALQFVLPSIIVGGSLLLLAWQQLADIPPFIRALAAFAILLSLIFLRPPRDKSPAYQVGAAALGIRLLARWVLLLAILVLVGILTGLADEFPRDLTLRWSLIAPLGVYAVTLLLNITMRKTVLSRQNVRTSIIAGVNPPSLALAEKLKNHPELCANLLGFFDDRGMDRLGSLNGFKQLGRLGDVAAYVRANRVDIIYIAIPIRHVQRVMDLLNDLLDSTISIYYVPDIFVFDLIQSRTSEIVDIPVVAMCETPFYGYRGVVKRLLDISLTSGLLLVAAPIMAVIAVLIKLGSTGPVIFRQRRYGLDGLEIVVYKFRTMNVLEDDAELSQATREDPRITKLGAFLRRFSLDELPQLFNVLEGKMSLVGPRPHAVAHNEQYRRVIRDYMIRHKVRPGITGLAQVNGYRGETTELKQMEARVRYDLEYLRDWHPWLDLKILARTALKVFFDKQAY